MRSRIALASAGKRGGRAAPPTGEKAWRKHGPATCIFQQKVFSSAATLLSFRLGLSYMSARTRRRRTDCSDRFCCGPSVAKLLRPKALAGPDQCLPCRYAVTTLADTRLSTHDQRRTIRMTIADARRPGAARRPMPSHRTSGATPAAAIPDRPLGRGFRAPAASRASTVATATLFGTLLSDRRRSLRSDVSPFSDRGY